MLKRSFLAIPLVAVLSMSLLTACGDKKRPLLRQRLKKFYALAPILHLHRLNSRLKVLTI